MKRIIIALTLFASPIVAENATNQIPDWITPVSQEIPDWDLSKAGIPQADPQEIKCLARNIYHEARGQPRKGQEAVALVTLNRLDEDESVCDVVYEKAQFSWTLFKKIRNSKIRNLKAYNQAKAIAKKAIEGRIDDFTNGATHYYAYKQVTPKWSKVGYDKQVIGDHIFMKLNE